MPVKKPTAPIAVPVTGPSAALVARAKKEGLALVPPLADAIGEFTIETEDDYRQMDVYLGDIARARKTWTAKLAPIRDPLKDAVTAAKKAMTAADALFKEVDTPLAELETVARTRMKDFQVEKQRRITAAAEEQQRIQAEIDRAAQVEAYGRTAQQRMKASLHRTILEEKQAEVFEAAPVLAQADGSGSRVSRKIRAVNPSKLLRFIADNYDDLSDCAEIVQSALNKRFKEDPEGMAAWPGVEIYDDVTIVRRS